MDGEFESFKEQVRSTANIVEVLSGYVPLKKRVGEFCDRTRSGKNKKKHATILSFIFLLYN